MISAELRRVPYARGAQMLVVTNRGPTIARNVRVTFEPELPDHLSRGSSTVPYLKARYEKPISTVVPGVELDNAYFMGQPQADGGRTNAEPLPDQFAVIIDYNGPKGEGDGPYHDRFELDTWLMRNRSAIEPWSAPHRLAQDALKALQTIATRMPPDFDSLPAYEHLLQRLEELSKPEDSAATEGR